MSKLLVEIGEKLKNTREAKQLSMEQVSSDTKIHPRVLTALENGNIEEMLNPIYIRSFIKTYAHYLDISDDSLIMNYVAQSKKTPSEDIFALRARKSPIGIPENINIQLYLKVLIISVLMFIFISYLFNIVKNINYKKKQKSFSQNSQNIVKEIKTERTKNIKKAVSKPIIKSKTVVKPKVFSIAKNELLKLSIKIKEKTWLQVKVDGNIVFQGVIEKDEVESWKAKKEINIWTGNAGGMEIILNGYSLGTPGKKGQVIRNISITRKGMKVK